jgi:hypothetical protein
MSPYAIVTSSVGTAGAVSLCVRLTAWHDAMVTHERRLRTGRLTESCDNKCPHVDVRTLWTEALFTLGPRASELTFLRSCATGVAPSLPHVVRTTTAVSLTANSPAPNRNRSVRRQGLPVGSDERAQAAQEALEA